MTTPRKPAPVGLTKDAGWQIGVQRSVPAPLEDVWAFLTSRDGLAVWLGPGASLSPEKGSDYHTRDGTSGVVKSYRVHDRIRLSWRPPGREQPTTLQVALTSNRTGTAIRFHQERLGGPDERAAMRTHWEGVLARLSRRWDQSPAT